MSDKGGLILADFMCGGGGSSTGILNAVARLGHKVKRFVAVNHDPKAIEQHTENYPFAIHFCKNVDQINLREAFPEGYVDFAWGSPTCTYESRAYGGRPINDQLRNGPWELIQASNEVYIRRWAIENVPEFVQWGPIDRNGQKIASMRGETFRAWEAAWRASGYKSWKWWILNAADFGAPTTRERFIANAARDRVFLSAPVASHSRNGSPDLFGVGEKKWRSASEIIDERIDSPYIVGRRLPLAAPTLSRAAHGMPKLWGDAAARVYYPDVRDAALEGLAYQTARLPKIVSALAKAKGAKKKKAAQLSVKRCENAIVRYEALIVDVRARLATAVGPHSSAASPFIVKLRGTHGSAVSNSADSTQQPIAGITAGGGHHALATPMLSPLVGANRSNNTTKLADAMPMPPATTRGGMFVVTPALGAIVLGQHGGGVARGAGDPVSTIAKKGAASIVEPMVSAFYGEKDGRVRLPRSQAEPLATAPTANRFGLAEGAIVKVTGSQDDSESPAARVSSMHDPLGGITRKNGFACVTPIVVPQHSTSPAKDATSDPISGITTTSRGVGIIDSFLVAHFGEREGQTPRVHSTEDPFPTVTDRGAGDLVTAALERVSTIDDPAILERLLIGEDGELYVARLCFRMLQWQELGAAMTFPPDYKWIGTKELRTRFIGQAVPPVLADAVTMALLHDVASDDVTEVVA